MRLPRLDFAGARHHVMNRAARREDIFVNEEIRDLFLEVVSDLPQRFGVRVHGYAIMPNHYHLMLESVGANLPRAMRHVGGEFSRRLNRLHKWDGPLFRGRYRNRIVATEAYWKHLLVYIHLNPQRSGACSAGSAAWTSHEAYLGAVARPPWLSTAELQGLFGSQAEYLAYYWSVASGAMRTPDDFDATRLWSPHSTGSVAVPDPRQPLWEVADALAAVSAATGVPLERLIVRPRGRNSNRANWLAAWWMSRRCGIDHGRIAAALFASHAAISQIVHNIEVLRHTDGEVQHWLSELEKVESLNT